jgi:hypothetical protein
MTAAHVNEFMVTGTDDHGNSVIKDLQVGKLELLPEPAGKVRTIAIVDYWTQRVMSPVHDWMMKILSFIPTDGTFNQEDSVASFAGRVKITQSKVDSIDLKSATDLIPIALYESLFRGVLPSETVDLWISLLTDRFFLVPDSELVKKPLRGKLITYGRGQPMGTLSSWPSMALVHHALELFSAWKTGLDPVFFVDYRILGDDNVTGNELVAQKYREVAASLCVPTSEAKTLSGRLFIFASQIYRDGVNLSPLSLKEELNIQSYSQRLEQALRACRRGWLEGGNSIARFLRLLLSQADYRRSVREWSSGRLGKIAQSALVSAFGAFNRVFLDLLGIRGSGFKPFLHAMQNKVEAIAGDQNRFGRSLSSEDLGLERTFALATAQLLVQELNREVERLQTASIRFRMWQDGIAECGYLPRATIRTGGSRGAPELPGILVLPSTQGRDPARADLRTREALGLGTCPVPQTDALPARGGGRVLSKELDSDGIFNPLTRVMDCALWPAIEDSYRTLFGVSTIDAHASDYSTLVESEEYGGHGGWAVTVPGLVDQVRSAQEQAQVVLDNLINAGPDTLGDVWAELVPLSDTLVKISRVPDFKGISSFYSPVRKYDVLTPWVRRAKFFEKIARFMPYGTDFTVPLEADFPVGPVGKTGVEVLLLEGKTMDQ